MKQFMEVVREDLALRQKVEQSLGARLRLVHRGERADVAGNA